MKTNIYIKVSRIDNKTYQNVVKYLNGKETLSIEKCDRLSGNPPNYENLVFSIPIVELNKGENPRIIEDFKGLIEILLQ